MTDEPKGDSVAPVRVTELLGDGIGPELRRSVHAVADALPVDFEFIPIDWSIANREALGDEPIDEAADSMRRTKLTLKYPTITRTRSPNALIRKRCNFSVIYRPAVSMEGVTSNFAEPVDLHIVRIATGGTYGDPGQLIGRDAAVSIRMVEREPCQQAAHFAFRLAGKLGKKVTSSSKHTIQRATDGLFEAVVRNVHHDYPDIVHKTELFDALLGKIILKPEAYQVILVLNEYGDFLSDMASGLVGSLGTGASGNFSFDQRHQVDIALFDAAHGTAPDIAGKDICNPTAILLAFAMLLDHFDRPGLGDAVRAAIHGAIRDGERTPDLGGKLSTTEFTRVIVDRLAVD